jgi:hypothetical protein
MIQTPGMIEAEQGLRWRDGCGAGVLGTLSRRGAPPRAPRVRASGAAAACRLLEERASLPADVMNSVSRREIVKEFGIRIA